MKHLSTFLSYAVVILIVALLVAFAQEKETKKKLDIAMANIKAYNQELSDAQRKSTAYQLTVEQMKYYQDSILKELDSTRKALKIKDKNLNAVQYVESSFTKTDTLILKDTLFREPQLAIDTTFQDEWYSIKLGLRYPSTIAVSPDFKSVKHIIVHTKKETVNPPKKFFLFRWFQKKHTVLQVDVVEKNPYVHGETSKYVEIIK